ncbi:MAG TPA: hypothetical protein VG778_09515 [Blastocatellia bacterium]|nr:hypothetical protein [Blastocatellia bacterium]
MTENHFEPITITGCDENRVRRSTRRKGSYIFPFSLSAKPPAHWADAFEDAWRSHRRSTAKPKPDAWVRKSDLVIECPLTDLKLHFPNFRTGVDAANKSYSEELQSRAEKDAKKKRKREEEQEVERSAIREALDGIDFS